jgi:hypothetical protein
MGWRRRYRSSAPSVPHRVVELTDYYTLRHNKAHGAQVTVTLLCDGGKMHKVTFYDRGQITLHNHNLRAERALGELGQEQLPRCVQLIKAWKQGLSHYGVMFPDIYKRTGLITGFRQTVNAMHREVQIVQDADGFDIHHAVRLTALVNGKEQSTKIKIEKVFNHAMDWRDYHQYENYLTRAKIDTSKVKLSTRPIGVPKAFGAKHGPSKPLPFDLASLEMSTARWLKGG